MNITGLKWIAWIITAVIMWSPGAGFAADIDSLVVTESGNVGVGTTDPGSKLHVNGAIRGNQDGALRIDSGYGYLDIGPKNAGYSHFYTDRPRYYFDREIQVNSGLIGSYDENLSLRTQGTTRLSILNSNGWVGIGTINPANVLHLNGNSGDFGLVFTNSANSAGQRGFRIAFDNSRLNFQRADDAGNFEANLMTIDQDSGKVGIGTVSPATNLDVAGLIRASTAIKGGHSLEASASSAAEGGQLTLSYGGNYNWGEGASTWNVDVLNRDLRFFRYNSSGSAYNAMQIAENGSVGIGTSTPQTTLHVNGTLKVNSSAAVGGNLTVSGSVTAKTVSWYTRPTPDYVFEESYRLLPLEEVEQYVKTHKHLPEIPSAGEIAEGGVDLVQMMMGQLKNIEELTLHMIAIKKENDALRKRLTLLESQLGVAQQVSKVRK